MASDTELEKLKVDFDRADEAFNAAKEESKQFFEPLDGLRAELDEAFKVRREAARVKGTTGKALSAIRRENEPKIIELEEKHDQELDRADALFEQATMARAHGDNETAERLSKEAEAHLAQADRYHKDRHPLVMAIMRANDLKVAGEQAFSAKHTEWKLARGRLNEGINRYTQSVIKRKRLATLREEARRAYRTSLAGR